MQSGTGASSWEDWAGQYVLAEAPARIDGWHGHRVGARYLTAHPSLPVVPVRVGDGAAGLLLGWPVSPGGELLARFDLPAGVRPEDAVYALGGRWVLITERAVYLDPSGSQPAVYAPDLGVVASSPGLIDAADDSELVAAFDVVRRDGWYPFGLTPRRGVWRLLPNYALDLDTFTARRHHTGPEPGAVSTQVAARAALAAVDAMGQAFAGPGLFVGLTAGNDSRMLLAGLRPHLGHTAFWTARSIAARNPVDVDTARRLARRFGLTHAVVDRVPTAEADVAAWLDRVGWVRAGDKAQNHKMEERAGGARPFGHGAIGGLGRGAFWPANVPDRPPSPEAVARQLAAPPLPAVVAAAERWLESLATEDPLRIYDYLLLEQRVGCWTSPGNLGSRRDAPTLFLLNRRDVVDGMLGIPHAEKRSGLYTEAVIRQAWPELLAVPFNVPPQPLWRRALRGVRQRALGLLRARRS